MTTITPANTQDLTVLLIKENQAWDDLLSAFETMMAVNVDSPLRELEALRQLDPSTSADVLQKTVRLLGFDPTQDVLDRSYTNLTRLVTQLPLYSRYNSTELFEKFIDLLLNAVTTVTYLYTQDYVNFYPAPKGKLITEGGPWFKTTHINLDIELIDPSGATQTFVASPIYDKVLHVFYSFSPAALVINQLQFSVSVDMSIGIGARLLSPDLQITIDY